MRSTRLIVRGVVAAVAALVVAVSGVPAAVVASPAAGSVEPMDGEIWGHVSFEDTGQLATEGTVRVTARNTKGNRTYEALTDSSGRFLFSGIPNDNYFLIFRSDGYPWQQWDHNEYGTYYQYVTVPTTESPLDVQLVPYPSISGRVSLGETGNWAGANDVKVTLSYCDSEEDEPCQPLTPKTTYTAADGSYSYENLEFTAYSISFTYVGPANFTYVPDDRYTDARFSPYRYSVTRDAVIPRGSTIEGFVTLDGGPVAAGDVQLTISRGELPRLVAVPDESGHFRFEQVYGGGTVKVTADYLGDADYLSDDFWAFYTEPDATSVLNIDLSPGARVSGTLLDSGGSPRAGGVSLWRWKQVTQWEYQFVNETGLQSVSSDGTWTFPSLEPGLYQLRASESSSGSADSYPAVTWRDPETGADEFEVAAYDHLAFDLTQYKASQVTMDVSCETCTGFGPYVSTSRRNEVTGVWTVVPAGVYQPTFPVTRLLPGDYRFTVHPTVGGVDSWVSPIVTLTEGTNVSLGSVSLTPVDLVVRHPDGSLYGYPTARGRFGLPVKVGTGYNAYSKIIEAGDVNGDGATDLLVIDKSGRLLLRAGHRAEFVSARFSRSSSQSIGGYGPAIQISTGWGGYRWIGAAGDLDGDGYADLAAQSSSGAIYLFRSDRDGGFLPRELVASWQKLNGYKILGFDTFEHRFLARATSGTTSLFSLELYGSPESETLEIGPRRTLTSKWKDVVQVTSVGSFDADGYTDYIVRTTSGKVVRWDSNEYGNLVDPVTLATGWSGRLLI